MVYETVCPKGHALQVTEAHFGEQVNCPTCGEPFVVPDLSDEESSAGAQGAPSGFSAGSESSVMRKLTAFSHAGGRPMLAVGLLLVLISRGCDTIGSRSVDRTKTKAEIAENEFNDEWEGKRAGTRLAIVDLQKRQEAERKKEESDFESIKRQSDEITALQEKLSKSRENQQKALELFELGTWRELKIAARDADANNRINAYWRAVFFVFATIVLALGLLAVSWTAEGAERWVCLIMLAIITFSIYIVGTAWTGLPL